MSSPENKRRSPYQGLIPYGEQDAPFFFGREKETRLIIANLFASPLTLLYGASGVGKSSVLRAGVSHQLRDREDLLVVVFNSWQSNPASDLMQAVADQAKLADPAAWAEAMKLLPRDSEATLGEVLTICAAQLKRRLMIILDQFEEYFLYHPLDDEFAAEFARAVTAPEAPVSFLISIREDFYAKLDRFEGRIPVLYDNYLRIEHLNRQAAKIAIERPIAEYNRRYAAEGQFRIEPELVTTVLRQVETGQVIIGEAGRGVIEAARPHEDTEAQIETPFLQLVMTRLWEKEVEAGSHDLRLETLKRLGGAENIVRTHLDAVITRLTPREQEIAASIFHYLVTPSGTKIAYTATDLAGSAELNEIEVKQVLEKLSHGDVRILRPVDPTPDRPGAPRYEIFHDVLAPAILTWRTAYVQTQERADAERRAEEQQQRADDQARVASRFRRLAVALAVVMLVALGAVVLAVAQTQRAKTNALRADNYAKESERLRVEGQLLRDEGARLARAGKEAKSIAEEAQAQSFIARKRTEDQIRIADIRKAEAEQAQGVARLKSIAAAVANAAANRATIAAENQASATRVAFSNLLSVQSTTLLNERPQLSTLLSVEAIRATQKDDPPTPAAEEALRQSLALTGGRVFSGDWDKNEGWSVKSVVVSPDGRWLATASDTVVRLFDLNIPNANAPAHIFNDARAPVVFSPDGHWLIAAATGKRRVSDVLLWDLNKRLLDAEPITLEGSRARIELVMISPDSRWLVASGSETRVGPSLWDLKSRDLSAKTVAATALNPNNPGEYLIKLAISPDSHWLVTSAGSGYNFTPAAAPGLLLLWNLTAADPTAKPLELSGHEVSVSEAVFSPDGRWLATGSIACDNGVRLWDLKAANFAAKPITLSHKGPIGVIAFSPDSRRLVTGSGSGLENCNPEITASVWDLTAADIAANPLRLPTHEGAIFAATFSPGNKYLITVAGRGRSVIQNFASSDVRGTRGLESLEGGATVHVWYWAFTEVNWEEPAFPNMILSTPQNVAQRFAVSPDNRWLMATSDNRTVLWDLTISGPDDAGLWTSLVLRGHDEALSAIAFSPDSRRLVTGSYDKTTRVWDLAKHAFSAMPLSLPDLAYQSPIVQSDDRRLMVATTDEPPAPGQAKDSFARSGAVALVTDLTASDPSRHRLLRGHKGKIKSAAFSADNRWLVTGSNDKTARLWDLTVANPSAHPPVFAGHQGAVDDVTISPDRHWLATAGHDGATRLWDLTAADPTARSFLLNTFKSPVSEDYQYTNRVYFSADSRWLVTSGHYYHRAPAALWDLKTPNPSASFTDLGMIETDDIAFSADGHWLLVLRAIGAKEESEKNSARLWDLSHKPLAVSFVLSGNKKPIYHAVFSADGRWLFTSSFEKAIRRWNLTAPDPSATPFLLSTPLTESRETLGAFVLSLNNRWLVAGSMRATHILWDLSVNDPNAARFILPNPDGSVSTGVAFAPDSRWLVTSSETRSPLAKRETHNLRWDLTAADPSVEPVVLPGGNLISNGAVSAEGRWLITRGTNRLDLWNMRLDEVIDLACRTAGRNLSAEEWKTYFPGQDYRKTCSDLPAATLTNREAH